MTKIYCFSGTGNSLWSAKRIAQMINETNPAETSEIFNIGTEAQKNEIVIEADAVIIVFPSYAFGLPLVVRRFVQKAVFKTQYIASFATCGSTPLGTLGILRHHLKKKKIDKMFFGKIPAVENYLALFKPPDTKTIEKRNRMQKETTEQAARCIIERHENKPCVFRPLSALVVSLFYLGLKIFYKFYRVSDNCNGCAVCSKICPVSAIAMKDGRPYFSSKCENCQGCVNICPLRAIRFGRVKYGDPGYCHPEITVRELSFFQNSVSFR
jgi:ferredoxin